MTFVLALKIDSGNYYPLTKDFLDIMDEEDSLNTLIDIDRFTSKNSLENILESIKRSNINFLKPIEEMEIVITYYENGALREFKTHTKDDIDYLNFNLINFIAGNLNNKALKNQLKDHFKKNYIPQDLKDFTEIYACDNTNKSILICHDLSYISKRLLKEYLYEINKKNEEKRQLKIEPRNI